MTAQQEKQLVTVLDKLSGEIRRRHYSLKTERSYLGWVRRFGVFLVEHKQLRERSPEEKIGAFLTALAKSGVAASTHNQAFNALRFFYLSQKVRLGAIRSQRVRRQAFIRVAPSVAQVRALMEALRDTGGYRTMLVVRLLYACGLRLGEALNLRVKDVDLAASRLILQGTKGGGARTVALPCELHRELALQVKEARLVAERDKVQGLPVALPGRMAAQRPARRFSAQWAFVFPAREACRHPRTGEWVRFHCHERNVQRCVKAAQERAGIEMEIVPHLLRHAYGTHAKLHLGADLLDLQRAFGHKQVQTTMTYLAGAAQPVRSPLDLVAAPP